MTALAAARRPIVAANWKMNTTATEASALAAAIEEGVAPYDGVDVVICPPAISLLQVRETVGSAIAVGAQNVFWRDSGAFTGELSPAMLVGVCSHVIIGHSERRQHFGETDETVHQKVRSVLTHGLTPIVCVGETLAQREAGLTPNLIGLQVRGALHGLSSEELMGIVLAYEPVWAIGTGVAASGEDANTVALGIRRVLNDLGGAEVSSAVRIQYGGSVTAANAAEFLNQPDIDGALVGGASLKPIEFTAIVRVAAQA
jgi:triosephosphate isomerase (TIM)